MSWTLLVATVAHSYHRQRTAPLQWSQGRRRRGGEDQRHLLLPLDGVVLQRRLPAADGEVLLRPLEEAVEEALGGVRVQVLGLGHHPQQEGGEPTQRQQRGVQEAAAGEQAVAQRETPVGAAPIHSKRRAGTCKTRTGSIIS